MIHLARALVTCAALAFAATSGFAADKAFQRDDLKDAAIKLEAQVKKDAGVINKPLASLRADADAAAKKNDGRAVAKAVGQIVTVAPEDAANWLRLAKTTLQIRTADRRGGR